MGNKTIIYRQKVTDNLIESYKHLKRLNDAFSELEKVYDFPIEKKNYEDILHSLQHLAYCDQIIYRFSKLQDCVGAKLFKSILMYQGENIDKPFLDILNQLEKMNILNVDEWFEIRDLRNEVAHEYEEKDDTALNVINMIYKFKGELENIMISINNLLRKNEK